MRPVEYKGGIERWRIEIAGTVQGVGFRPFVYRLAEELDLSGWVSNNSRGVIIEAEGPVSILELFEKRLEADRPKLSAIGNLYRRTIEPLGGFQGFSIRASITEKNISASILPDLATCPDCRIEIFNPDDRRYLYPFINCTNCGPRFSIIEALPYDRPSTTMKKFQMCPACLTEYENPSNRRFHAQPNACPECGPHIELWNKDGEPIASRHEALLTCVEALKDGKIVAVKGLGGFHLMVDATDEKAVLNLRVRKRREEKPLAIMCPDIDSVRSMCESSEIEENLLISPASPIVLLKRKLKNQAGVAASVAPGNPCLGIMLPYTPLHLILMREFGRPIVATSGNLSDEPICIDAQEALDRLGEIADLFLIHDRPIARHVDDSIVRIMAGREMIIRRARGYAPLPITIKNNKSTILAAGGHLKNTVALAVGNNIYLSQHIGDLETRPAENAFREVIKHFENLYQSDLDAIACDMHPDYISTHYAKNSGQKTMSVQHHLAHILSCMAENQITGPVLGVGWDGTGYGPDGIIWGGEFLKVDIDGYKRFASFRNFPLPGGEAAVREPRRAALGLLYELFDDDVFKMNKLSSISEFSEDELSILGAMMKAKINTPLTSSVGRLFDAVASILGIRQVNSFEGQAAMEMEYAIAKEQIDDTYELNFIPPRSDDGDIPLIIDWKPMIRAIIKESESDPETAIISAKFHNTLASAILEVAFRTNENRIVLSGGCFQNKYLLERTVNILKNGGLEPIWHRFIPPNDGGIALGQIMGAAQRIDFEGKNVYRHSRTD